MDRPEPGASISQQPGAPSDPAEASREASPGRHAPRAWVTWAISGLLLACYVATVIAGAHPISPSGEQLLKLGARHGPAIADGQWWRMLTSGLLHYGALHLVFNLWALLDIGPPTERALGRGPFAVVYLLSTIGASIVALVANPLAISAGASGAVFGVYGASLAWLLANRRSLPQALWAGRLRSLAILFLVNIGIGLTASSIGLAAHLGGAGTGMLAGWLLMRDPAAPQAGRTRRRYGVIGLALGLGVGVFGITAYLARDPRVVRLERLRQAGRAFDAGQARSAIALLTESLREGPDAQALFLRGLAHWAAGDPLAAESDLTASLALAPSTKVRLALCGLHARTAPNDDAAFRSRGIEACSRAISDDPKTAGPWLERARIRARQEDSLEALADLDRAISLKPDDPQARLLRAVVLARAGRLEDSERECAWLTSQAPVERAIARHCANVAWRRGDLESTIRRLDRLLGSWPGDVEALLLRARAAQAAGRNEEAVRDLLVAVRLDPRNSTAFNNLAWAHVIQGDEARALPEVEASLAIKPDVGLALGTRCFALAGLGRLKEARRDCAQATLLQPGDKVDLGMLALLDGRRREAERLWREAGQDDPGSAPLRRRWLERRHELHGQP